MMGSVLTPENEPPVASFIWSPSNPTTNTTITFDASASTDLDGTLRLYEWDWNNDSVYEESGPTPTATHSWMQPGDYPVTVKVADNDDATSTKTFLVTISSDAAVNNKGTPGFELVFAFCALVVTIFLLSKKRNL
jgi:hypothetical protein